MTNLRWQAVGATECMASGGWNGPRPPTGSEDTLPLASTTSFTLTCNGPTGSGSGSTEALVNLPPVVQAGVDQTFVSGTTVVLNGSKTYDPDYQIASYSWQQIGGLPVVILGATIKTAAFIAPQVSQATPLMFRLVASDTHSPSSSGTDDVMITVLPTLAATVPLTGRVQYQRVPFRVEIGQGLDYANQIWEPSRGVRVEVVAVESQAIVATTTTTTDGSYAVDVPPDTRLAVRVVASMMKQDALPNWLFYARDISAHGDPYSFSGASFIATAGGAIADVTIPSGWSASGTVVGTRHAAPFAILDTIYRAYTAILSVEPQANFPPLELDWAIDNTDTFFNRFFDRKIVLSGETDVDTEEHDAFVIAHEFGHYVQGTFSRLDRAGGAHSASDVLDPCVAFVEGFATGFAATILNDPIYRNSFGNGQAHDGYTNLENTQVTDRGWYNELSVALLLWDLYDGANEADDNVSLGLQPLWDALVVSRTTPALVSIFPFITSLRQTNPSAAAGIDQVVSSQNIVAATIDEYGSTETNDVGSPDVLPIYTPILVGGPAVTVRSTDIFWRGLGRDQSNNKLSVHRYLRLDLAATQTVRIKAEATTQGRQVIFGIWRQGVDVDQRAYNPTVGRVVDLTAGTYILDVVDCDNAYCGSGRPGPADIIVTAVPN